ncbi:MAG: asparagine synthase (glutamine-hydrolyzing) [Deltaproteobacteria bacterium]|nr:asparagine synthase (glutamine-hydrolyzing) [Deltaproteobacteria bacterium]
MCGIVGFAGHRDESLIQKFNQSQLHRGPDEGGFYFSKEGLVNLAMRRLSILDLEGGHQPMFNADKSLCIVFNGEIFNAPELRKKLQLKGYKFQSHHSDTEVLIHLYAEFGEKMLTQLNGMFAFVIHDSKKSLLFGARDHFGIKPLYYSLIDGKFAFASEMKSLLTLPWINLDLNLQAVSDFLSFQCVPAPHSIFESIHKLPAANSFSFDLRKKVFSKETYWKPKFDDGFHLNEEELPKYIRSELNAAVRRWTLSDVPIACSLSGGIDSSSIVALLAENSSRKISTFSLGFHNSPELDESDLARKVAEKWNTDHHEILLDPDDLLSDLDAMIYHLDEPYAGGLPSWFVFKEMAKSVKVGMTGTGGDELFGNYGKWLPFTSTAKNFHHRLRLLKHNPLSFKDQVRYPIGSRYHLYFRQSQKEHSIFLGASALHLEPSEKLIENYWNESLATDPRNAVPSIDFRIQLPDEFLHMTDRFSMAHSLEARTPFLDREFVEKMQQIPSHLRSQTGNFKNLLLKSVSSLLPSDLIHQKKRGFILPEKKWLRGRLREQVECLLSPQFLKRQGIFQERIYTQWVAPHLAEKKDYSWKVWTLLMFQLWYDRFINHQGKLDL